jgi:hypothetical protein
VSAWGVALAWLGFVLAKSLLLWRGGPDFTRRAHPWLAAAQNAFLAVVLYLLVPHPWTLALAAPALAALTLLQIAAARFCASCGRSLADPTGIFRHLQSCPRCGRSIRA